MQDEEEGQWTGSSEEDTMEEELYECKVEVKQQNTMVSWNGQDNRTYMLIIMIGNCQKEDQKVAYNTQHAHGYKYLQLQLFTIYAMPSITLLTIFLGRQIF